MKLLLDEMYPRELAERLRGAGFDVVAVVEHEELVGRPDLEIARWARDQQRVVLTENVADYATLDPQDHAGLILLNARHWRRSGPGIARIAAAVEVLLSGAGAEEPAIVRWL